MEWRPGPACRSDPKPCSFRFPAEGDRMRTASASILAVLIFIGGALAGTAVSAQRRSADPQCGTATAQVRTTLYFGLSKQKGSVSELEWQTLLRDEVTARFPNGLTTWEADGQWRGACCPHRRPAPESPLLVPP